MMKPLLLCFAAASFLCAQAPDVIQTGTLTAVSNGTPIFVGAGGPNGAVVWRLTYFVDGTAITAAQLAIQGADAPTAAGCSTASYSTIAGSADTIIESTNPSASGAQGNVGVKAYYPCIRARATAITGSAGTIKYQLAGWKFFFNLPVTVTIAPPSNAAYLCPSQASFNLSGSGNTEIIAASGTTTIRICHISFSTTTAEDIKLTSGTGSNCASGTANVTGLYKSVSAMALEFGPFGPLIGAASGALCINQSVAEALGGVVIYDQR